MHVRWLSAEDVQQALPVADAVEAVREAYISSYRGDVLQPVRLRVDVEQESGAHLVMPSHQYDLGRSAVKIVSVFPGNTERGVPVITGIVALFDGTTGVPLAIMDGAVFTAIRTGAASGVATEALSRPDARTLAVIGAGAQAPYQALAVCSVRAIERIQLYNRTRRRAEDLARSLQARCPGVEIEVFSTIHEAVADADVICTATASEQPILSRSDVRTGAHVNAIGSFRPDMRELDGDLLREAGRVYVEMRDAAFEEAGELVDAYSAGILAESDLVEIGAVLAGDVGGRRAAHEITVFKSTGIAAQDLHAGARLLERAERENIGTLLKV